MAQCRIYRPSLAFHTAHKLRPSPDPIPYGLVRSDFSTLRCTVHDDIRSDPSSDPIIRSSYTRTLEYIQLDVT